MPAKTDQLLLLLVIFLMLQHQSCTGSNVGKKKPGAPLKHSSPGRKQGSGSPHPSPGRKKGSGSPPVPTPGYPKGYSKIFDVLSYGAKGDGVTDDTKAFQSAWQAACNVESAIVEVPAEFRFLVGPISFSGPCQPKITFQIDGTIIAPVNPRAWGPAGMLQWIQFSKLNSITIQGCGVIDGRGSVWWGSSSCEINSQKGKQMPNIKPTALRFYGSIGATVTGITIQNSPQCHLKFDSCTSVEVSSVTISSPLDSPNTDGIHLQNSQDVEIHHSSMACGDDCVSIQTGCSNVRVHNINCGPGHGISIGGLGKDQTKACVSNITVYNSSIGDTLNGVRIKTWQGGLGSVKGVSFSNIQVSNVKIPIVIDQFYCDKSVCTNQSAAVAISGVTYENIRGTYAYKAVHLACSDDVPCTKVVLTDIELHPVVQNLRQPFCWKTYGEAQNPSIPPIYCLHAGQPYKNPGSIQSNQDGC